MRNEIKQPKKLVLPILLVISICFNILYLFGIIDFKIRLIPQKTHQVGKQFLKHNFIDSPIHPEAIPIHPEMIADTTDKKNVKNSW
jgi:hypothetical protein